MPQSKPPDSLSSYLIFAWSQTRDITDPYITISMQNKLKLSTCCKWNVAENSLSSSENLPANFTHWNSVLFPFMIIHFDSSMSNSIMWIVKARAIILFEQAYHFEWHKPCSDHVSYKCVTVRPYVCHVVYLISAS